MPKFIFFNSLSPSRNKIYYSNYKTSSDNNNNFYNINTNYYNNNYNYDYTIYNNKALFNYREIF